MVQTTSGRPRRPVLDGARPLSVAGCVAALGLLGCDDALGPVCTADFRYGLNISVHDGSGAPAADEALGIAIEGAHVDTLMVLPPATMVGAGERPGTYDITISKTGYMTWSAQNVTVEADECHVIPVALEANLVPVP